MLHSCLPPMAKTFRGLRAILAQNVRTFRRELRWTQEELAGNAGLDRTQVSAVERSLGNPSLETIAKMAEALQVPAAELLARRPRLRG